MNEDVREQHVAHNQLNSQYPGCQKFTLLNMYTHISVCRFWFLLFDLFSFSFWIKCILYAIHYHIKIKGKKNINCFLKV